MFLYSIKKLQIVTASVLMIISSSALAQPSGRGGGGYSMMSAGGMSPDYLLRDLPRFQAGLDLSDEQSIIVEQILRDYDESFREASDSSRESMRGIFSSMWGGNDGSDDPLRAERDELRARSREIREKLDSARKLGDEDGMKDLTNRLNSELEEIRAQEQEIRMEQWQSPERQASFEEVTLLVQDQLRLKRQMRDEFEGDLVAILTEGQQDFWPPLQRQLIRDRLLPQGRLSGESVDIMSLVEQQEFSDEILTQLLPVLNDWDLSVTPALTSRDDHMVQNQGLLMTSFSTMDMSEGVSVMKTQAKLAESVRDINDDTVTQIVLLLPSEEGKAFNDYAKERGYPRIYRPGRTERAYQGAMELEGLDPEILTVIKELYSGLLGELIYANEQILSATHRWESQEQIDRMNRFASRMSGGNSERSESPIEKAEESKRVIEDNYLEQLRMLLTEEQIEALGGLQKREERNRGRGNRGGDAGSGRGGGGFEGGREEFMNRFDKDGDGNISESEREEIREYFRNNGGQGGGFGGGRGGGRGGGAGQGGGGRGGQGGGGGR